MAKLSNYFALIIPLSIFLFFSNTLSANAKQSNLSRQSDISEQGIEIKKIKINKNGWVLDFIGTPLIKKNDVSFFRALEKGDSIEDGDIIETRDKYSYVIIIFHLDEKSILQKEKILQINPDSKILFIESDKMDTDGFVNKPTFPSSEYSLLFETEGLNGEQIVVKATPLPRRKRLYWKGVVVEIENIPLIKKKNSEFYFPLKVGEKVEVGDIVEAREGSSVKILEVDGANPIVLKPQESFQFILPWESENPIQFPNYYK